MDNKCASLSSVSLARANIHPESDPTVVLQLLWLLYDHWHDLSVAQAIVRFRQLSIAMINKDSSATELLPEVPQEIRCRWTSVLNAAHGANLFQNMLTSLERIVETWSSYVSGLEMSLPEVGYVQYISFLLECAVEHGVTDAVSVLTQVGVDIHDASDAGMTALMGATLSPCNIPVVRMLVNANADINCVDEDGRTALTWACMLNHATVARELIAARADVDVQFEMCDTALIAAAKHSSVAAVQVLLAAGADTEALDEAECTALMCAARCGHSGTFHALLAAGVTKSVDNIDCRTLLMCAAEGGDDDVLQTCLRDEGVAIDAGDRYGATALMYALEHGRVAAMRALVAAGADVDARDENMETALAQAALYGSVDEVQALLELRADVHVRDKRGTSVLVRAACNHTGDAAIMEALLSADTDSCVTGRDGQMALLSAVERGHTEQVRLLLCADACVGESELGRTALMAAAAGHDPEIVVLIANAAKEHM